MSTVTQLIDRIKRGWLEPPDAQPIRATLGAALSDSATTLTYDASFLAAEEEELLGAGSVLEIGSELIVCGSVDETAGTISGLRRGTNGTVAAAHDEDDEILVMPMWSRQSIYDAISDVISSLWPELYEIKTSSELTLSDFQPTDVPAEVDVPLFFWRRSAYVADNAYSRESVEFFDSFPVSATGKAITVSGGGSGYLVYRKRMDRPTAETDDLQTLGVADEWERLIEVAAVAHLVAGREAEQLSMDFISEQLEAQSVPVGTPGRTRDSLVRYEEFLRNKAQGALKARHRVPSSRRNVFGS